MSVTKGHKIINILPTPADQETPHRVIYLHLDEPYDPPKTYVNNVLFQCSNRPNVSPHPHLPGTSGTLAKAFPSFNTRNNMLKVFAFGKVPFRT
jgi:hypothetical protein